MDSEKVLQCGRIHFPNNENAAARFDLLAEELGGCETLRPQQAILLADLVRADELKEKLIADIEKRGIGSEALNGRQRYWRENKSVSTLMKLMDQQRRTMQTLGLIAKELNLAKTDDDEDEFDRF